MGRRSSKEVRESRLTQWQRKKESRMKKSEDFKNGRAFFNLIKNDEKGAN